MLSFIRQHFFLDHNNMKMLVTDRNNLNEKHD
jgi:hypothetical protein